MLTGPHIFSLRISNRQYSASFTPPATIARLPKLYTIYQKGKLLYVGITKTRMSARLRAGLRASGEHGYYGYKLVDDEYRMDVWIGLPKMTLEDLESIEAEVVYNWRRDHGDWPCAQNEIHFHRTEAKHREMAERIVAAIVS